MRASQYQLAKDLHYELQQITMNGNNKTTDGVKAPNPGTSTEDSDAGRGESEAPLAQNSNASTESNPSSGVDNEDLRQQNVRAPAKSTEHKVGRDRLANGKWPPGVSGNPKGRKPKSPSNDWDVPSALDQALEKKTKVKDGGKKRTLTMRTVILEQWITQAAKGDHRARQQLIAYGDKHGSDLFAGQHKAIREAAAAAAAGSSAYVLSEEVLDRLSPSTLDEIREVMEEIEAQKKNSKTMH